MLLDVPTRYPRLFWLATAASIVGITSAGPLLFLAIWVGPGAMRLAAILLAMLLLVGAALAAGLWFARLLEGRYADLRERPLRDQVW